MMDDPLGTLLAFELACAKSEARFQAAYRAAQLAEPIRFYWHDWPTDAAGLAHHAESLSPAWRATALAYAERCALDDAFGAFLEIT